MRVYQRGSKWYADIRLEGHPRTRRPVGDVEKLSQEQARVEAYRLAATLERTQPASSADDPPTLHGALLTWMKLRKRGRTDQSVVRVIRDEWPDCPLDQVSDVAAAARLGDLEDGTFDRYVSVLNAALAAVDWPRRLKKRNTPRDAAPRCLTAAEWKRLRRHLPAHLLPAVEFSLATGLRRANVFGLRWADVNLKNRTVTVWARRAKGRRTLHLPLSDWAVEVLRGQLGKHETMVFPYQRETEHRVIVAPMADPKTAWGAALERAKITDFRWHDLRHTWATWSVQAGTPLKVLQELGGWASLDMVMVYAHAAPSHLQQWANAVREPGRGTARGTGGRKAA